MSDEQLRGASFLPGATAASCANAVATELAAPSAARTRDARRMGGGRFHDPHDEGKRSADRAALLERVRRAARGNERIVEAFRSVPREVFVPAALGEQAYDDRALPLADGQTISQPTMIAIMLAELDVTAECRVLEVGAGSGYAAALLSRLAREVHTVERLPLLANVARENLARAGITNVTVHDGDGSLGLEHLAPFDRILVSAGARDIPSPLVEQLAAGGRMAIPTDAVGGQVLQVGQRDASGVVRFAQSVPCAFVPLVTQSRRFDS